jgi:DNA repair protein RadA/Sms
VKRGANVYRCQQCGFASAKPGTCPDCARTGEYPALVEERPAPAREGRRATLTSGRPRPLREVELERVARLRTQIGELDRVLGGGVVPGSLVLIGGDPGIGKCVTSETRVLDPHTGDFLPIVRWRDRQRSVVAVDVATLRTGPAHATAFHEQGRRSVVAVRTRLGRRLRCTANHPLLTPEGWQAAGDLKRGDRVASPRTLPFFGGESMPEAAVKLVAYVIGDGSAGKSISVTSALPEVWSDLEGIASELGLSLRTYAKRNTPARHFKLVRPREERCVARREFAATLRAVRSKIGISWEEWARRSGVSPSALKTWRRGRAVPDQTTLFRLARTAGLPPHELNPAARDNADRQNAAARILNDLGLRFISAADKAVPERIFRLPRHQLALFLRTLMTCDGSVYVSRNGQPGISYSTISRRLGEDVQHLLLRFGLVATLRTKMSLVGGCSYTAYEVAVFGVPEVKRFVDVIGILGREPARAMLAATQSVAMPSTRRDLIPTGPSFWKAIRKASETVPLAVLSRRAGITLKDRRHDRPLCRQTVEAFACVVSDRRLDALASGNVYWDEVDSVTPDGEADVYDLTVPGRANFVANDLVVHNSTLIAQAASRLAEIAPPVLYVSAEESAAQVRLRADRLGIKTDALLLWAENDLSAVEAQLDEVKPRVLVIDSIQTVFLPGLESAPGSVAQVRECGARLMTLAKGRGLATFLVGHVTKDGSLAGPRVLEHLVDTVLYFEGEQHHAYRVLRAVKNRFGSTNELGVFQMGERGLEEVANPSGFFLAERPKDAPGSVVVASLDGTRPLLLELQALVAPASFGTPRRTVLGADYNRVCLLLAVLEKRAGVPVANQDVFVNVAGGGRITEPAADLGIVLATASSYMNCPLRGDVVVLGEVGLTGEVRAVTGLATRLREAAQLGFREAVVPASNLTENEALPLEVHGVATVDEAIRALLR